MSTVFVCVITVELYIPMLLSLKAKRKQIKSLKDKIQNRFNVSIAEVSRLEDWQHGVLGMSFRCYLDRHTICYRWLQWSYSSRSSLKLGQ